MAIFPRRGDNILNEEGCTKDQDIMFSNAAHLKVYDGYGPFRKGRHTQFRLKFCNGEGDGWLVDQNCLDELIAELLYIKAEIMQAREEQPENDAPF